MKTKEKIELLESLTGKKVVLKEGISASSFTRGLVTQMQKFLPKDIWTVKQEYQYIIVTNDFEETATYEMVKFKSNEGTFRGPNFPEKGSADE